MIQAESDKKTRDPAGSTGKVSGSGVRDGVRPSRFFTPVRAINLLAVILTAGIPGPEIGAARAAGAVAFSVVIGATMHLMFRKEEKAKAATAMHLPESEVERPLWQNVLFFAAMVGFLVSATL